MHGAIARLKGLAEKCLIGIYPPALALRASRDARSRTALRFRCDRIEVVDRRGDRMIWISRHNAAYATDMQQHFDYYFGSAQPFTLRIDGRMVNVVDFSTPRRHMVAGFDDFPVLCPSLTEPFVTCEQYLDFAALKPGEVVLDLGAYSGLTAIAFSKAVGPSGRVISVEPDAGNHAAAIANIDLHRRINGLSNITLLRAAAGGTCGTLLFSSEGAMGSSAVDIVGRDRGEVVEVAQLTVADILQRCAVERVDFVKMDIEGAEAAVLDGARPVLRRCRPRLIIEPHVVDGRLSSDQVIGILESEGYRCSSLVQHGVDLQLITAVPAPSP